MLIFPYLIFRKNIYTISFLLFAKDVARFQHIKALDADFYDCASQSRLRSFLYVAGTSLSCETFVSKMYYGLERSIKESESIHII